MSNGKENEKIENVAKNRNFCQTPNFTQKPKFVPKKSSQKLQSIFFIIEIPAKNDFFQKSIQKIKLAKNHIFGQIRVFFEKSIFLCISVRCLSYLLIIIRKNN